MKKSFESSQPGGSHEKNEQNTKKVTMPFDPDKPPSVAQKDELSELEDREIDFSDIPPLSEEALKNAIRNPYIRAQREGISVREAIKRSIAERDAHRSKHEKRKAS